MAELNEVRPLELADESRIVLDLPALNSNPVSHGRPVFGKLARSDKQGALAIKENSGFDNYQMIYYQMLDDIPRRGFLSFSQKVRRVLLLASQPEVNPNLDWTDPTGTKTFKELNPRGKTWIEFSGTNIWFSWSGYLFAWGGTIFGFY